MATYYNPVGVSQSRLPTIEEDRPSHESTTTHRNDHNRNITRELASVTQTKMDGETAPLDIDFLVGTPFFVLSQKPDRFGTILD